MPQSPEPTRPSRRRLVHIGTTAGVVALGMRVSAAEAATPDAHTVYVRQFGAKGDGRTDDSAAINRAVQFMREHQMFAPSFSFGPRLVFSSGLYVVESPINLTGLWDLNAVIDGNGAVIVGRCRGQPVIDALGSRFLTMRDLSIVGDKEATPRVGLQIGRLNNDLNADDHCLINVKLLGRYGLACLLNIAAETSGFDHVFCWNDNPDPKSFCLIQDGINYFRTVSSFVPGQHARPMRLLSFNENEFINCHFRHSGGGVPVWLGDTSRHRFYRCFATSFGKQAAFVIYSGLGGHTMLDIDCHCEPLGLQTVFNFSGDRETTTVRGFSYKDHGVSSTRAVFARVAPLRHVQIQHARIAIARFFNKDSSLLDSPTGWSISGEVYLGDPDAWNGDESFVGTLYLGEAICTMGVQPRHF